MYIQQHTYRCAYLCEWSGSTKAQVANKIGQNVALILGNGGGGGGGGVVRRAEFSNGYSTKKHD